MGEHSTRRLIHLDMTRDRASLNKSDFNNGLACPRCLWFQFNEAESLPEQTNEERFRLEEGKCVGQWAKRLYPDGVDLDEDAEWNAAIRETQNLVKDRKTLFEGAFEHGRAICRTDILLPVGRGKWDLIEVKGTTSVKADEHPLDVAFQQHILQGCGLKIRKTHLMHLNGEYTRKGEIDPGQMLMMKDITAEASEWLPVVREQLPRLLAIVDGRRPPSVELGKDCQDPLGCPVCSKELGEQDLIQLYRGKAKAWELLLDGHQWIAELPEDVTLTIPQQVQRQALRDGEPYVAQEELEEWLAGLRYPLHMLDFETIFPAVPMFDGTCPYQQVPFQFSLHTIPKKGANAIHVEFLADGAGDPRPALVKALKKIGSKGTVLAFNATFERKIIEGLAEAFPKDAPWLKGILDRMDDLIIPFRKFWYHHPGQHGSCSQKAILPAMMGVDAYAQLAVSQGMQASQAFYELMSAKTAAQRKRIQKELLAYCKQDTKGMVDILNGLNQTVAG